jgi:hypothetical protein
MEQFTVYTGWNDFDYVVSSACGNFCIPNGASVVAGLLVWTTMALLLNFRLNAFQFCCLHRLKGRAIQPSFLLP